MARHKLGFEGLPVPGAYTLLRQYDGFGWLNTGAMDPVFRPDSGPANVARGEAAAFNAAGGRMEFHSLNGAEFTVKKALFSAATGSTVHLEFMTIKDGQIVSQFELDIGDTPQRIAFHRLLADIDTVSIKPTSGENTIIGIDNMVISSDAVW